MNETLKYYEKNADKFVQETTGVEFSEIQNKFLIGLEPGARVLDFGCGSGRDTKYFVEKGYIVEAIDGSAELCRIASEYAGIQVKCMLFKEFNEVSKYDGIWACASILHLPQNELQVVIQKMVDSLVENGIIYISFKYGEFEGERNGRYFTDMTEESFQRIADEIPEATIKEIWKTTDVRPGRGDEQWLNIIMSKTTT